LDGAKAIEFGLDACETSQASSFGTSPLEASLKVRGWATETCGFEGFYGDCGLFDEELGSFAKECGGLIGEFGQ